MTADSAGVPGAAAMTRRVVARAFSLLLAASLGGCALWRPTTVPIRQIALPAACMARPDTLLVFLPGSYSSADDFIDEGFVATVRERRVAADVLLVDAHLGYYSERSIVDRLHADVVVPARAAGYRHVWLIGISIGGYGALLHSLMPPAGDVAGIDGIVLIAPYLGDRRVSVSVESAGGLRSWPAPAAPLPPNEVDQAVWRWLQGYTKDAVRPRLFLGYGESDRFEFSDRLLAAALPPAQVVAVPGGHDWPTWRALWRRLLPAMALPVDASCVGAEAKR